MTFEQGVIVCWFLFLVWACISGIARAQSMEGYQRTMLIGRPSRLQLLLVLSFILLSCFRPVLAYAETEDEETEENLVSEIPDNYYDVLMSRTSPYEVVTIEGDEAVLVDLKKELGVRSVDPIEPWYAQFVELTVNYAVNGLSSDLATINIMHDLAWRYYNYPAKRDKIPVKPSGTMSFFSDNVVYSLSDCSSYGEWCRLNKYFKSYDFSEAIEQKLYELNNQGKSWTSESPGADELYKSWYEYYEGTPSSGGSQQSYGTNNMLYPLNENAQGNVTLSMSQSIADNLNNWVGENDSLIIYGQFGNSGNYSVTNKAELYISATPLTVELVAAEVVGDAQRYNVKISSESNIRVARFTIAGSVPSITATQCNNPINTNNPYWISRAAALWTSRFEISTGGGGGSNEPVPSPGPTPKPQPQQPIITTVNSPTYNNVTYQTINQTDVDLQPIIDALAVHDENMQDAWNAYSILFDDWMETLKTVIENWEQVWLDWTNTLYQDLQYYLDQIQYVLYEILMALQSEPYVPVPQPETVTINFDNAVDQLSTRFPFSIPWDVKLIMELLEQPRQAPEFDLPVVMTEYTVHIDFSPFENMAAVSRFMSLILFTGGLLMATKKMIGF